MPREAPGSDPRQREVPMRRPVRSTVASALLSLAVLVSAGPRPAEAAPEGQLTWGVHISLAPTWFDPAETPGIITPFMVMSRCTTPW